MEAICIAEFDQRTKARDQAEKAVKELKDKGNPHKHIVVPEVGYHDCYGLWFFSSLTDIIRQIAAEKFNEEIGRMMHVYLDLEPKKVADGLHPVGVYRGCCMFHSFANAKTYRLNSKRESDEHNRYHTRPAANLRH